MNQIVFLFLIIILAIGLPLCLKLSNSFKLFETFSNYTLDNAIGNFPEAQTKVLVQDTYPAIGKNKLSDNDASDIWFHYPVFEVGSYSQITNNIRFPDNPDEGTCMPASMCGALYKDKIIGNNYIEILPPLNPTCPGTRVGYFDTGINLLPFRNDMSNILY